MVRTHSGLGNRNRTQQPEPQHVIERAPEVVPVVEPVTMVGVQSMI